MSDRYGSWSELAASELEGTDFALQIEMRSKEWIVAAPHGGGIEPGTTEIARSIASHDWSFYSLEGTKDSRNSILHITSHRFDEPRFLSLAEEHDRIIAVHGCGEGVRDPKIDFWIGGADEECAKRTVQQFLAAGYAAAIDTYTPGKDLANVCNRGRLKRGLQLELSERLRKTFFAALTGAGRKTVLRPLEPFVSTVREVLGVA